MKTAIIYCRGSLRKQTSVQRRDCIEFCSGRGWDVLKVFTDQVGHAKSEDQRALKRLLQYCAENKGRINAVLVSSPDRITRSILDLMKIKMKLRALGVEIVAVDDGFSLDSDTGLEQCIMEVCLGSREMNEAWRRRNAGTTTTADE
jgi:DNA invertase Pin-like site-specific DNA recombinase